MTGFLREIFGRFSGQRKKRKILKRERHLYTVQLPSRGNWKPSKRSVPQSEGRVGARARGGSGSKEGQGAWRPGSCLSTTSHPARPPPEPQPPLPTRAEPYSPLTPQLRLNCAIMVTAGPVVQSLTLRRQLLGRSWLRTHLPRPHYVPAHP